jgi:hypothetical protein
VIIIETIPVADVASRQDSAGSKERPLVVNAQAAQPFESPAQFTEALRRLAPPAVRSGRLILITIEPGGGRIGLKQAEDVHALGACDLETGEEHEIEVCGGPA